MRRGLWALLLGITAGCSAPTTCAIDPTDAGCVTQAECSDAGDGLPCAPSGLSCQLCVPSYHSYVARCEAAPDGGARWRLARGTPPPGCPPE